MKATPITNNFREKQTKEIEQVNITYLQNLSKNVLELTLVTRNTEYGTSCIFKTLITGKSQHLILNLKI